MNELEAKLERLERALQALASATNSPMLQHLHQIAKAALQESEQDG